MAEDDLQVNEQLTDLHIEVGNVETQHEVEVVCQEPRNDTCRVQMECPHNRPKYPYRTMLRKKAPVRQYSPFQRQIKTPRKRLEYFQRHGVLVVFRVTALIQPPDDQPQDEQAREDDSHDLQQHEHHVSDSRASRL